jgi:hypothetical protein
MIHNGVIFSIRECEVILDMLDKVDYMLLNHKQLDFITQLRSIVRDNPIGTHIEQYHD